MKNYNEYNINRDIPGVRWRKDIRKWQSSITVRGITYWRGYYDNKEDAVRARLEAEVSLGVAKPEHYDLYEQFRIYVGY